MEKGFFQIKYEVTRNYYIYLNGDKYTPEQSAGRCYDDFYEEIENDGIESIIAISTIIGLLISNGGKVGKDEYNDIKMILYLYDNIDICKYLNESECEYLQDDIRWLSEYYKKI